MQDTRVASGSRAFKGIDTHLSMSCHRHPSYFVGLLLRGTSLPYANFGHVVLAKPSPILFYPISSTEVLMRSSALLLSIPVVFFLLRR